MKKHVSYALALLSFGVSNTRIDTASATSPYTGQQIIDCQNKCSPYLHKCQAAAKNQYDPEIAAQTNSLKKLGQASQKATTNTQSYQNTQNAIGIKLEIANLKAQKKAALSSCTNTLVNVCEPSCGRTLTPSW
jgi:hypothetical protein